MVWCLARDNVQGHETQATSGQALDLVLAELVLCLVVQSASFMYRYEWVAKHVSFLLFPLAFGRM